MITVRLPPELAPAPCGDLVRLGRDHDGGYLVSAADVLAAECLVGLGINDDWSFEEDFSRRNDCAVLGYDGSVSLMEFFLQVILSERGQGAGKPIMDRIGTFLWFQSFFSGNRQHLCRFVTTAPRRRSVPFSDVAARVGGRRVFLKIDIEGDEYGLLGDIQALSPRMTGLVIEFHDCQNRIGEVCRFVGALGLTLVHVHANNFGNVSATGLPDVIELTFSKGTGAVGIGAELPHPLDRPNHPGRSELAIRFV